MEKPPTQDNSTPPQKRDFNANADSSTLTLDLPTEIYQTKQRARVERVNQEAINQLEPTFHPNLKARKIKSMLFLGVLISAVLVGILMLMFLLMEIGIRGMHWVDFQFLTSFPSRFPVKAGIFAGLSGTIWVILTTTFFSVPLGVGTAIYLEEYAKKSKFKTFIDVNIANLAGVPSIIYGLLGLAVFVRLMAFGSSVLSGALTMTLLILPIIIVVSREAVRSVPGTLREASYALGATRWQTIYAHVLPNAVPSILTGIILAISRAIGETAPLIMVGAVTYISFTPQEESNPLLSAFTVLPLQIYDWTSRPQDSFQDLAAAGIVVLLVVLLSLNAVAIFIRNKYQRKIKW